MNQDRGQFRQVLIERALKKKPGMNEFIRGFFFWNPATMKDDN